MILSEDKNYGCSPAEWDEILKRFPHADLLPIASKIDAKISPKSKLKEIGKVPSGYNHEGDVVGMPNWTGLKATDLMIARWRTNPNLGVGVQTRDVRGLDADISSS